MSEPRKWNEIKRREPAWWELRRRWKRFRARRTGHRML